MFFHKSILLAAVSLSLFLCTTTFASPIQLDRRGYRVLPQPGRGLPPPDSGDGRHHDRRDVVAAAGHVVQRRDKCTDDNCPYPGEGNGEYRPPHAKRAIVSTNGGVERRDECKVVCSRPEQGHDEGHCTLHCPDPYGDGGAYPLQVKRNIALERRDKCTHDCPEPGEGQPTFGSGGHHPPHLKRDSLNPDDNAAKPIRAPMWQTDSPFPHESVDQRQPPRAVKRGIQGLPPDHQPVLEWGEIGPPHQVKKRDDDDDGDDDGDDGDGGGPRGGENHLRKRSDDDDGNDDGDGGGDGPEGGEQLRKRQIGVNSHGRTSVQRGPPSNWATTCNPDGTCTMHPPPQKREDEPRNQSGGTISGGGCYGDGCVPPRALQKRNDVKVHGNVDASDELCPPGGCILSKRDVGAPSGSPQLPPLPDTGGRSDGTPTSSCSGTGCPPPHHLHKRNDAKVHSDIDGGGELCGPEGCDSPQYPWHRRAGITVNDDDDDDDDDDPEPQPYSTGHDADDNLSKRSIARRHGLADTPALPEPGWNLPLRPHHPHHPPPEIHPPRHLDERDVSDNPPSPSFVPRDKDVRVGREQLDKRAKRDNIDASDLEGFGGDPAPRPEFPPIPKHPHRPPRSVELQERDESKEQDFPVKSELDKRHGTVPSPFDAQDDTGLPSGEDQHRLQRRSIGRRDAGDARNEKDKFGDEKELHFSWGPWSDQGPALWHGGEPRPHQPPVFGKDPGNGPPPVERSVEPVFEKRDADGVAEERVWDEEKHGWVVHPWHRQRKHHPYYPPFEPQPVHRRRKWFWDWGTPWTKRDVDGGIPAPSTFDSNDGVRFAAPRNPQREFRQPVQRRDLERNPSLDMDDEKTQEAEWWWGYGWPEGHKPPHGSGSGSGSSGSGSGTSGPGSSSSVNQNRGTGAYGPKRPDLRDAIQRRGPISDSRNDDGTGSEWSGWTNPPQRRELPSSGDSEEDVKPRQHLERRAMEEDPDDNGDDFDPRGPIQRRDLAEDPDDIGGEFDPRKAIDRRDVARFHDGSPDFGAGGMPNPPWHDPVNDDSARSVAAKRSPLQVSDNEGDLPEDVHGGLESAKHEVLTGPNPSSNENAGKRHWDRWPGPYRPPSTPPYLRHCGRPGWPSCHGAEAEPKLIARDLVIPETEEPPSFIPEHKQNLIQVQPSSPVVPIRRSPLSTTNDDSENDVAFFGTNPSVYITSSLSHQPAGSLGFYGICRCNRGPADGKMEASDATYPETCVTKFISNATKTAKCRFSSITEVSCVEVGGKDQMSDGDNVWWQQAFCKRCVDAGGISDPSFKCPDGYTPNSKVEPSSHPTPEGGDRRDRPAARGNTFEETPNPGIGVKAPGAHVPPAKDPATSN